MVAFVFLFIFLSGVGNLRTVYADTTECTVTLKVDIAVMIQLHYPHQSSRIDDLKTFVKFTLRRFRIDPEHTRIALVQFAPGPVIEFGFNQLQNEDDFKEAIDRLSIAPAGYDNIADSLIFIAQHFWTRTFGARIGDGSVQRLLIVLTDVPVMSDEQMALVQSFLNASSIDTHLVCIGDCEGSVTVYHPSHASEQSGIPSDSGFMINRELADQLEQLLGCNHCYPDPCNGRGECRENEDASSYICTCRPGYGGAECDEERLDSSFCDVNPTKCLNGGTCLDGLFGSYKCLCKDNCFGFHCEECEPQGSDANACITNPCENDCQCIPSCRHSLGYFCQSPNGYIGKNCSIPVPLVRCESNEIVISVSKKLLEEYDEGLNNSYIYVAPGVESSITVGCRFQLQGDENYIATISSPFKSCLTELTSQDETIVVSNKIWFGRDVTAMFDMPVPVLSFQCKYEKDYSLISSLESRVELRTLRIIQRGLFETTIELCKVRSHCAGSCPAHYLVEREATYTVGEVIHIKMGIVRGRNATVSMGTLVVLDDVMLSCEAELDSNGQSIFLVEGGCRTLELPTSIRTGEETDVVCLSFQTPMLKRCRFFYIHARLRIASRNEVKRCSDGHGYERSEIEKRSTHDQTEVESVLVGPIFISTSEKIVKVFPERSKPANSSTENELKEVNGIHFATPIIIVGLVIILGCLFMYILFNYSS